MLKIFRKRQSDKLYPQTDKAATFFARSVIRVQSRIADWLSKYEQRMTIPEKKIVLVLFCISMSILIGSFLYHSVIKYNAASPTWIHQLSIVMPEMNLSPDSAYMHNPNRNGGSLDTLSDKPDSNNR